MVVVVIFLPTPYGSTFHGIVSSFLVVATTMIPRNLNEYKKYIIRVVVVIIIAGKKRILEFYYYIIIHEFRNTPDFLFSGHAIITDAVAVGHLILSCITY